MKVAIPATTLVISIINTQLITFSLYFLFIEAYHFLSMSAIPSLRIQNISLEFPQPYMNRRVYALGNDLYGYEPRWWHRIFCCVWRPPTAIEMQQGTERYQTFLIENYGVAAVRSAQSICKVYLDDKIANHKPLLVREIISMQNTLTILQRSWDRGRFKEAEPLGSSSSTTKTTGILEVDMESCEITEHLGSDSDDGS